jgi:hypothetical protein
MAEDEAWKKVKGSDLKPGDRIRTADGSEMTVSRIEERFFGMDNMIALIEDTPTRWLKRPIPVDSDIEVISIS